ncbi:hypothetical protein [Collinsella tanakaei]|uniref:hypothetical protein n=1 Tax=Collinsella tanakaei TaxID=626935 RepID=UPI0025A49144|nr:hypothetical protein [Collinsella tanakaei]MDM8302550.1 hypothetical protein [Collinsella tanakaei]
MGLMGIYNRLPVFLQNVAFSVVGANIQRTRFGKGFDEKLQEFESHLNWDRDRLLEWRDAQLRKLVKHAYETVPYYHRVMDEGGVNPDSIRTGDDLKRLPVLTKQMVRDNPESFRSSRISEMRILPVHTSGTTGSSFRFDSTLDCQQAQFACFWRCYRQHGLDFDTWQAQFSSRGVVPQTQKHPPFWRIDFPGKRYYMSAFHESERNLGEYYKLIASKRIRWISGYPSLIALLAQWMNRHDLRFDHVDVVSCGAENLLEWQVAAMHKAFGVDPIETYGQTENVAIFSKQPNGKILVDEDFSVVEFEKADGSSKYSVIGTSLFNYATPLIRYKTTDLVTLGDLSGNRREVAAIDGREEDYIALPSGEKVGKLDHVFKDTSHFVEAQIAQFKDYSIELRVVGDPAECAEDEAIALHELEKSIGDSLSVSFKYCESIPRTRSGKLRFVVSDVDK